MLERAALSVTFMCPSTNARLSKLRLKRPLLFWTRVFPETLCKRARLLVPVSELTIRSPSMLVHCAIVLKVASDRT